MGPPCMIGDSSGLAVSTRQPIVKKRSATGKAFVLTVALCIALLIGELLVRSLTEIEVATVDPDSASSKDALDIVRECGFQVASFRNA